MAKSKNRESELAESVIVHELVPSEQPFVSETVADVAPVVPVEPPAPDAPTEQVQELRLPPSPESLKGTPQEAILRIWAEEKRPLCTVPGCYYPLAPFTQEGKNIVVVRDGKKVQVAVCSYDPEFHNRGEYTIPL